jgi:hypothetical protein
MTNLSLTIAGQTSPDAIKETPVKGKDHTWFSFRPEGKGAKMTGYPIRPLAPALPTSVAIDGVTIPLTVGLTSATDFKTGVAKEQRNRVSATGKAVFPSLGEEKMFRVAISETKSGQWNITISLNRGTGSVSPETRAASEANVAQANSDAFGF